MFLALAVAVLLATGTVWPLVVPVIVTVATLWGFIVVLQMVVMDIPTTRGLAALGSILLAVMAYTALAIRPATAPYANMGDQLATLMIAVAAVGLGLPGRRAS